MPPAYLTPDPRYGEAVLDFDPTIRPYPRFDPIRQPCRALLTQIVLHQGQQPGHTRMNKVELQRAQKRLRDQHKGLVADERSCADALERIRRAILDWKGNPPVFETEATTAMWNRLNGFLENLPHSGVLADLED